MGRTSDEEGETSAKTCRSDDSSERPLKKARYVWQIKGKYHLKKPENEEGAKLFIADETRDGYTLHPIEMSHPDADTQNQEPSSAGDSTSAEVAKSELAVAVSPPAVEEQSPMESEVLNPWQLQKWQARQVARCFVDNTINRVLEDMGFIPLPVDADDLMEDFTMSGLHRNEDFNMSGLRRNDAHLEDAAVMMAIHSHGLQTAVAAGIRTKSNPIPVLDSCTSNLEKSIEMMKGWYAPKGDNSNLMYEDQPITNGVLEEDVSVESDWDHCSLGGFKSTHSQDCDSQKEEKCQNQKVFIASEDSTKGFDSDKTDAQRIEQSDDPMYVSDAILEDSQDKSSSSFEHTDFLDKAVAVAIQKKGLSTLSGIEYG